MCAGSGDHRGAAVTRFKLWAPACAGVQLELGERVLPMSPADDGWLETDIDAPPGSRYRFIVGDTAVPDPAARMQEGAWSIVTESSSYRWHDASWRGRPWEEAVIYELHVGLLGGFKAVAERLPALVELGITAIELMPIAQFPGAHNWGYDGVLPYAPSSSYGTPDDLKHLVDRAHALGLMVFLDVVYNHFGPEGNYLPVYAPDFFRQDKHTPWGAGIDFRKKQVRRFFIDNAIYWVRDFHIDGLRLDAVHAIDDDSFIAELAREVRDATPKRFIHIVIENERNNAVLLQETGIAQWNDDFHHAVHVLLTGETEGYYAEYADKPAQGLAKSLSGRFIQERSGKGPLLAPTAFVNFLQNHDHVGNRAFGERLTVLADEGPLRGAIALLILSPPIPLVFFGEEAGAREPFLYFCDHSNPALADAVRKGRRGEFAKFRAFQDDHQRECIPDPNAIATYESSRPSYSESTEWRAFYRELLRVRREWIVPRLKGALAEGAQAIGGKAVRASWRMGDGARLTISVTFGDKDDPAGISPPVPPIWNRDGTQCWIEMP
jgi:maltooligosyltrehalose trehalohydrolase